MRSGGGIRLCQCVCQCDPCATAAEALKGTNVAVASVVGFPTGAHQSEVKKLEAQMALDDGADELDMVINLAVAQSGDLRYLLEDIGSVLDVCRKAQSHKILKVIFETAVLEDDTIISLCELCDHLGVDFIKTSTGLHAGRRGQCRDGAADASSPRTVPREGGRRDSHVGRL